jgi:hypothetical protein
MCDRIVKSSLLRASQEIRGWGPLSTRRPVAWARRSRISTRFAYFPELVEHKIATRVRIVARHDAVAKALTARLRSLPGVTVVEEPPAPTAAPLGARADLKVEVKARKWLMDVAIVCPATKSVVAR